MSANTKLVLIQGDPSRWSVAITRETIQRILKHPDGNNGDMLALWMFYAYTARWQHTNKPRAVTNYTAEGLDWSPARVRRGKKQLSELGLVADAKSSDVSGKITGWYIEVFYLATAETVHTNDFPQGGKPGDKCSRTGSLNALGVKSLKKTKEDTFCKRACSPSEIQEYEPEWKPQAGTKEQKLRRIKPPKDYPSEEEFSEFSQNELQMVPNYRDNLYLQLCQRKWHEWKKDRQYWKRIRNWKAYVMGLEHKIESSIESLR